MSIALALGLIRCVIRFRPSPLRTLALLGTLAVLIYEGARACEGISGDFAVKMAWERFAYIGISALSPLELLFACTYTAGGLRWARWQIATLWIIPCTTVTLVATNDWHHLFWRSIARSPQSPTGEFVFQYGPWFWVAAIYNYTLILIASAIILWTVTRLPRFYRGQVAALLVGGGISTFGNLLRLAGVSLGGLDIMPCVFILSTVVWLWTLSRYRVLDVVPIAREALVERMADGVVVLDHNDRVVDMNPAAQQFLCVTRGSVIGEDSHIVLGRWPMLVMHLADDTESLTELAPPDEDSPYLEAQIRMLRGMNEGLIGRLVVLRDISAHKQAETHLHEMYSQLQAEFTENEMLRVRLREEAIRDPLTGLYNRRYLRESLTRELARAARDHAPISLVMLDIDQFKTFNDRYGHAAGDAVLQRLGELLGASTRTSDIICRYGGEEFLVVLPGSPADATYQRVEQWRAMFQSMLIAHGPDMLSATFSAGIATFPTNGRTDDELLVAADRALYAAKNHGRNRVITDDAPNTNLASPPAVYAANMAHTVIGRADR